MRKSSALIGVFCVLLACASVAYAGECTNNDWQPTFVRHDSVAPTVYYFTGTNFLPMSSPDEATQFCRSQGVRMVIRGQDCFQRNWGDFGCGCNITPSRNTTCANFQRYLSTAATTLLGRVWDETESGWTGVWTRRGASNVFDAAWTTQRGQRAQAVLTIDLRGNQVTVSRRDPSGGTCRYTGLIASDLRTVRGTYNCTWAPGQIPWSASIR